MKKHLILITALVISYSAHSQTRLPGASGSSGSSGQIVDLEVEVQLRKDIDEVGLSIANKLMRCCSTWGGNHVYSKVDYENVRQNTTTDTFTIPMQVGKQSIYAPSAIAVIGARTSTGHSPCGIA